MLVHPASITFFLLFIPILLSARISESSIFSRYIRTLRYRQPVSFIATLTGSAIQRRLKQIPAEALLRGQRPVVRVFHRRHAGQVILVENVDPVFRKMFSLYNSYINLTGIYITSKGETWPVFSKSYSMKKVGVTGKAFILKIRARHHAPGNYGIFAISRRTMMITHASFYSRGEKIYSIAIAYRFIGRYLLPFRMVIRRIRSGSSSRSADIRFSSYRLNSRIPDNIF